MDSENSFRDGIGVQFLRFQRKKKYYYTPFTIIKITFGALSVEVLLSNFPMDFHSTV